MATQEGCVTVTWDIRNFSFFLKAENRNIYSPNWCVEDTWGKVSMGPLSAFHYDSQIKLSELGFRNHCFRTEMSFISSCGIVLLKTDPSGEGFYLENNVLFDKNNQSILLNDTMTLCFKAWNKTLKISEYHFVTVVHSVNHRWTIEKPASSDSHDTYFEQENFKLHISLRKFFMNWDGMVETEPHLPGFSFVDFALSIKDGCGQVLNYQKEAPPPSICSFSIRGIPNITGVTLQLELIVALYGRHELSAASQAVRETQLNPNSPTSISKHKNVSGALGDDLLLLYRQSALSDATLNTKGMSFSVHRTILAARSPVFRAMFEKDETSEGRSGVVDIDDLDSETVDRMLVYLYADSVRDLEWKEASALYYAADKYAILPLKEKCADFLKACLAADNACDVLVFADRHSDQELMTRVVNFILGHEEVVSSGQWEQLEKDNPMLCAKITRELFLKRGKK